MAEDRYMHCTISEENVNLIDTKSGSLDAGDMTRKPGSLPIINIVSDFNSNTIQAKDSFRDYVPGLIPPLTPRREGSVELPERYIIKLKEYKNSPACQNIEKFNLSLKGVSSSSSINTESDFNDDVDTLRKSRDGSEGEDRESDDYNEDMDTLKKRPSMQSNIDIGSVDNEGADSSQLNACNSDDNDDYNEHTNTIKKKPLLSPSDDTKQTSSDLDISIPTDDPDVHDVEDDKLGNDDKQDYGEQGDSEYLCSAETTMNQSPSISSSNAELDNVQNEDLVVNENVANKIIGLQFDNQNGYGSNNSTLKRKPKHSATNTKEDQDDTVDDSKVLDIIDDGQNNGIVTNQGINTELIEHFEEQPGDENGTKSNPTKAANISNDRKGSRDVRIGLNYDYSVWLYQHIPGVSSRWRDRISDLETALKWIRQEVFQIKQEDRYLMRQLLDLRARLHQLQGLPSHFSLSTNLAHLGSSSSDLDAATWSSFMSLDEEALGREKVTHSPMALKEVIKSFQDRSPGLLGYGLSRSASNRESVKPPPRIRRKNSLPMANELEEDHFFDD